MNYATSRITLPALLLALLSACGGDTATRASAEAAPQLAAKASSASRGKAAVLAGSYIFAGKYADYTIARAGSDVVVTEKTGAQKSITFNSVGKLLFSDLTVVFDTASAAAQAYRLYQAAFDRAPDSAGLGFHVSVMEGAGVSLTAVAQGFVDSAEFTTRYGALDNSAFLTQLYQNILHRAPDPAGLAYWLGLLDGKALTRGQVLAGFADSPENSLLVAPAIDKGVAYVPFIVAGAGSAIKLESGETPWNLPSALNAVLRDARGQEVPGAKLACSAPAAVATVSADCRSITGLRLGQTDISISGAGVSATLRVKVVPQRQILGTQSSSGSGSGGYNLLVTPGGDVMAWGSNHSLVLGQGSGSATTSSLPVWVKDSAGTGALTNIVQSSAGETDAMALTDAGQVMVWGELHDFARSGAKQLPSLVRNPANNGPLSSIVQVAVGSANAVALADDGRVFTWGRYTGQGVESLVNYPNQPKNPDGSGALGGIVQVAAGFNHALALGADGRVYGWGWNNAGETGRGTAQTQEILPATVKLADGSELRDIVQIVAGYHFSLALAADGRVYAWGDNAQEQLGLGTGPHGKHYFADLVKDVSGVIPLGNIVMLAAGKNHALALDGGGRVLSWGFGNDGRLGEGVNGIRAYDGRPLPVAGADGLGQLTGVVSIAAGPGHSLAVLADGTVMTWGDGYGSSLGQGGSSFDDLWLPAPVKAMGGSGALKIPLASYPNLLNRGR